MYLPILFACQTVYCTGLLNKATLHELHFCATFIGPLKAQRSLIGPYFATVIAQRLKAEGEEPKVRIAVSNSAWCFLSPGSDFGVEMR